MAKGKHSASMQVNRASGRIYGRSGAAKHAVCGGALVAARPSVVAGGSAAARIIAVLFASAAIVGCLGIGFASAGGDAASVVENASSSSASHAQQTTFSNDSTSSQAEAFILETSAYRDLSGAVAQFEMEEAAAAEAAIAHEQECIERAQAAQSVAGCAGDGVDFSVGRDEFIRVWSQRIDDYLAGSNLAGYGTTFADAAFEYGVDPRWSPAISNTESGKGTNCFAWHNAWGWTDGAWSNWVSAIYDHVKGLSEVYGYTISPENAQRYCPPNHVNWYRDTLGEMARI